jgi:hypothetical protein
VQKLIMNVARKPADRQRIQAIEPVLAARIETDRHDQTLGRGDKAGAKRQRRLERDHGLAEPAPEPKSRHQHATNQSGKFKILDHLDKLTHHKGDKYICPVCGGNNLSIGPETGAYNCFSGCETQAIREAIAPWADRQSKATRNQPKRQWVYADADGSLLIRVNRTDDSQGEKRIWQEYQFNGVWVAKAKDVPASTKAQAKAAVMPYRYREAMQAASQGDLVYWVEGEKCADALWNIGIPATTSIGGSDGYKRYGDYSNVFVGVNLVIAPDRDIAGIKYADAIAHDYPQAKCCMRFPVLRSGITCPNPVALMSLIGLPAVPTRRRSNRLWGSGDQAISPWLKLSLKVLPTLVVLPITKPKLTGIV